MKLIITVIEAKGIKEANLFTKMTTYVHFKCGSEEFKTKPAEKQGTNPRFGDQSFIFNLDGKEEVVHIALFAKETLSDDRIGRMDVKIADLVKAEKPTWFEIFDTHNFSKTQGQLQLKVETEPPQKKDAPKEPEKHHHHPEHKAAETVVVQQPQVVQQQPQVVQQQPQVIMQQQPQQMPQQMMFGMPQMMGMPQVMIMNPQTGQPQVMFNPQMFGPNGQPMVMVQAPMGQFGQPVRVQYPNQQQQQR